MQIDATKTQQVNCTLLGAGCSTTVFVNPEDPVYELKKAIKHESPGVIRIDAAWLELYAATDGAGSWVSRSSDDGVLLRRGQVPKAFAQMTTGPGLQENLTIASYNLSCD